MLRLADTSTAQGRHQVEVAIAFARAALATVLLFAITLAPQREPGFTAQTTGVHVLFAVYSVVLLLVIRSGQGCSKNFIRAVHIADVLWPAILSTITSGLINPYLIFYVFVLFAASYRWGKWNTLLTIAAICLVMLAEAAWIAKSRGASLTSDLLTYRFALQAGYLGIVGLFFAYLKDVQNRRNNEQAALLSLVESSRTEIGVNGVIEQTLSRLAHIFGAARAALFFQTDTQCSVCVWDATNASNPAKLGAATWSEVPSGTKCLSFLPRGAAVHLRRESDGKLRARIFAASGSISRVVVPENEKLPLDGPDEALAARLSTDNWIGALSLEAAPDAWFDSQLPFLQTSLEHIVTVIDKAYLTEAARRKAVAMERIELGRKLHDGVLQSLFALEMQLFLVRRFADESELLAKLEEMQSIVHDQLLELRDIVQEIRTIEVNSEGLQEFIANAVDKFARESGIAAHFADDTPRDACRGLSDETCKLVARIVHEALVNVRKHSRAHAVLVRLGVVDSRIRLTIEDDGRGFKFQGRLSLPELDASHTGPAIIKTAARNIGAELTIESSEWRGTKIEVDLPKEDHYATAAT